jgi:Zn-dependent protease
VFLLDPPPSQFDIRFKLLGIPVRVHPYFWLMAVLMGLNLKEGWLVMLWVAAVFLSILVHEFGHALSARACGWPPRVVLYSFGGFASYQPDYQAPWRQIGILFAGPGAGFVLAALISAALIATNRSSASFSEFIIGWGPRIQNDNLRVLVFFLLQINIAWGLMNLLPVYPLDGGQIARELWGLREAEVPAMRKTLVLSIATGIIVAAVGLVYRTSQGVDGDLYLPIFFGLLAFNAYRMLRQLDAYGGYDGGGSDYDDDQRWR